MGSDTWKRDKVLILEGFILVNFVFLILDIYLAHSVNRFRHWAEWIPFWFSIVAAVLLAVALRAKYNNEQSLFFQWAGQALGYCSIAVGITGLIFHLDSQFFSQWTIASLVYTAPFVAPLAYSGIGFLLLLNRMVPRTEPEWGQWIVFLALGGFAGNFVLTLCDHAQNGFFHLTEWVPVVGSALAVGFLATALFERSRWFLHRCLAVLALQAVIGIWGFVLHLIASVNGVSSSLYENFIHGAPVLAPMLFANLFLLGAIGIWDLLHSGDGAAAQG